MREAARQQQSTDTAGLAGHTSYVHLSKVFFGSADQQLVSLAPSGVGELLVPLFGYEFKPFPFLLLFTAVLLACVLSEFIEAKFHFAFV